MSSPTPLPVNVGDVLADKYHVERVLGAGGMGMVVAAKHLTLGERYAIKFLLPQALAREDVVKRFKQEGQAAARIRSEHVARVFDVGSLADGSPYLVMEYLDGNDLGAILRDKGRLSVEDTVEYVLQACLALADAHTIGIIHRDLKPSNLFIVKASDGSPTVKLIDFGISKVVVPEGEGGAGEMTQTAVMMGSPLYMAPEQMASARDVDGRADIWSLGIILHTLLTGTPPFKAASVMQIYELIVAGAPPIRGIRSDVPAGLEAAILKCLEKDRRKRFADVGELADAIAEFGSTHARYLADRTRRIVRAKSAASMPSVPPPSEAVTPPIEAPATGAEGKRAEADKRDTSDRTPPPAGLSSTGSSDAGVSQSGPDPQSTDGPWGQRTSPPSKSRRSVALIAAGLALAVGAPAAFFLLRGQSKDASHPTPGNESSGIVLSPSVSAPAPTSSQTPAVVPAPEPPPSVASAAPPPSGKPAIKQPIRPPSGPSPVKRPPSGDDLFKDQGVIRKP